jgi:hypothetical protein
MYRLFFLVPCIVIWLAMSRAALAQGQPPDLTVTFHDVAGAPAAGVTVIVRDEGGHELARATTDAHGVATFSGLPESQVRVVIAGTLLNGTKLYQPGNDAQGIALLLDPPPTVLDLRSETDGMVVPDPATMAALEPGVPVATGVVAVPTAPIATQIPLAPTPFSQSAPAPGSAAASVVPIERDTPAEGGRGQVWLGIGLLAVLIGAGIGIVVVQRRSA